MEKNILDRMEENIDKTDINETEKNELKKNFLHLKEQKLNLLRNFFFIYNYHLNLNYSIRWNNLK